jgi:multiple sugar transport system ATP-binding protein
VDDLSLTIHDGEFMVFVGPSGCGKSTTLRMIAGLEEISRGNLFIDGVKVNDIAPKDRDIAMVFQNYALYPHMTVFKNMAFGLELRNYPKQEIARRVQEAAEILGLSKEMLGRKPKDLSGGQRQRVALGRAIVRKPKVFLFDEPLSNLDAKMRVQMRTEISKLHHQLASTMIYVTHDQVEAMTMGDRICVMKDGRIQQVAQPLEIYNRPATTYVGAFIGNPPMNFFEGTLVEKGDQYFFSEKEELAKDDGMWLRIDPAHVDKLIPWSRRKIILGIRPEDIEDRSDLPPLEAERMFRAKLEVAETMGAETFLHLKTGAQTFIARTHGQVQRKFDEELELEAHMDKAHFFEPGDLPFFKRESGDKDVEAWQASCRLIV